MYNKDSLNISYSEVFDCLYFWIYIFVLYAVIHKGVVFIEGLEFLFPKPQLVFFFHF